MSPIHLVPYDPTWPEAFADIQEELSAALEGVAVLSVEHVGSTSVPGLPANPVIDIDVVVEENTVSDAITALERVGYRYEGMKGVADRHAFRSPGAYSIALRKSPRSPDAMLFTKDCGEHPAVGGRQYSGCFYHCYQLLVD